MLMPVHLCGQGRAIRRRVYPELVQANYCKTTLDLDCPTQQKTRMHVEIYGQGKTFPPIIVTHTHCRWIYIPPIISSFEIHFFPVPKI